MKPVQKTMPSLRKVGDSASSRPNGAAHLGRTAAISPPTAGFAPNVQQVLRSPGLPLDAATRDFMEPRFGYDFSAVRVHTDRPAAESARAVGAAAYTVGRHVVFGAGRYAPQSVGGRPLLAHELTHVVQQGAAPPPAALVLGDPADAAEHEAEQMARAVSAPLGPGMPPPKQRAGLSAQLQRSSNGEDDLHKPMIEQFRKEHGLPAGGRDENGASVGPSDAEIKYGSMGRSKDYVLEISIPPVEVDASGKTAAQAGSPDPVEAALQGGTRRLASFDVDRGPGKHPWNLDQLSKDIVVALEASPKAYVRIFGIYSSKSSQDDPKGDAYQRAETVRKALIQWIGPKRFDESRYDASVGSTIAGPEDPAASQIEVWISYRSGVVSGGPVGERETSPKGNAEKEEPPVGSEAKDDDRPGLGGQAGAGVQGTPKSSDPRVHNDPVVSYVQLSVTLHDAYLVKGEDLAPWLKKFSFLGEPGAQLQYHLTGAAPKSVDLQVLGNVAQLSLEAWKHKLDLSVVAGGMVSDLKSFRLKDAGKSLTPVTGLDVELGLVKIRPHLKLNLDAQGLVGWPSLDAAGGTPAGRKTTVGGSVELRLVLEL